MQQLDKRCLNIENRVGTADICCPVGAVSAARHPEKQASLYTEGPSSHEGKETRVSRGLWQRVALAVNDLFSTKTFRGNRGPFLTIPRSCAHMSAERVRERQKQLTHCFHAALKNIEGSLEANPNHQFCRLRAQGRLTLEVGLLCYFAEAAYLAFSPTTRFNKFSGAASGWAGVFDIESLDRCRDDGSWIKSAADEIRGFGLLLRFKLPRSEKPDFSPDRMGEIDAGFMIHIPAEKLGALGAEEMAHAVLLDGRWRRCSAKNESRWKPAQRFAQEGLEMLFALPDAQQPEVVLRELKKVYDRTHPGA